MTGWAWWLVPAPRTGTQRQEDPEVCPLGELRFSERLCLKTEQMNEWMKWKVIEGAWYWPLASIICTHTIHTRLKIKMLSWSQCLLRATEQWLRQKAVWHSYPEGHIGSFSDVFWQGFVYSMLALKSEARDDLELLILLPPTLEYRDYRCARPCLIYVVLGMEPGSFVSAGQALHQLSCIPSVTLAICEKLISMV